MNNKMTMKEAVAGATQVTGIRVTAHMEALQKAVTDSFKRLWPWTQVEADFMPVFEAFRLGMCENFANVCATVSQVYNMVNQVKAKSDAAIEAAKGSGLLERYANAFDYDVPYKMADEAMTKYNGDKNGVTAMIVSALLRVEAQRQCQALRVISGRINDQIRYISGCIDHMPEADQESAYEALAEAVNEWMAAAMSITFTLPTLSDTGADVVAETQDKILKFAADTGLLPGKATLFYCKVGKVMTRLPKEIMDAVMPHILEGADLKRAIMAAGENSQGGMMSMLPLIMMLSGGKAEIEETLEWWGDSKDDVHARLQFQIANVEVQLAEFRSSLAAAMTADNNNKAALAAFEQKKEAIKGQDMKEEDALAFSQEGVDAQAAVEDGEQEIVELNEALSDGESELELLKQELADLDKPEAVGGMPADDGCCCAGHGSCSGCAANAHDKVDAGVVAGEVPVIPPVIPQD